MTRIHSNKKLDTDQKKITRIHLNKKLDPDPYKMTRTGIYSNKLWNDTDSFFLKSWFRLLIKWFSKLVHIFLFWPLFKCRCWVCTIAKLDTANCTIGSARFDRIRIRNIFEYTYLCSNCVFFYSHAVHVKYIIHIIECILGVHFLLFWFFIFLYILQISDTKRLFSSRETRVEGRIS